MGILIVLGRNVNRPFTCGGISLKKNEMWLNKIEILGSCVNKISHIGSIHCGFICGATLDMVSKGGGEFLFYCNKRCGVANVVILSPVNCERFAFEGFKCGYPLCLFSMQIMCHSEFEG